MYLVGVKWFSGNLQAFLYNAGIVIWIMSETVLFAVTGKKDKNEKDKSFDGLSVIAVLAVNLLSCFLALSLVGLFHTDLPGAVAWIGIAALYLGVFYRWRAVCTLRRFFTVTVQIKEGHKIIRNGPYAHLRHPAYTGSILSLLGMQLGVKSAAGFLIVLMLVFAAYGYRIHVEEAAMAETFGPEYEKYRKETKTILPYIF